MKMYNYWNLFGIKRNVGVGVIGDRAFLNTTDVKLSLNNGLNNGGYNFRGKFPL